MKGIDYHIIDKIIDGIFAFVISDESILQENNSRKTSRDFI